MNDDADFIEAIIGFILQVMMMLLTAVLAAAPLLLAGYVLWKVLN